MEVLLQSCVYPTDLPCILWCIVLISLRDSCEVASAAAINAPENGTLLPELSVMNPAAEIVRNAQTKITV